MNIDEIKARSRRDEVAILNGDFLTTKEADQASADRAWLLNKVAELDDALRDMVSQFAYEGVKDGRDVLGDGGLSALENAWAALDLPHPCTREELWVAEHVHRIAELEREVINAEHDITQLQEALNEELNRTCDCGAHERLNRDKRCCPNCGGKVVSDE